MSEEQIRKRLEELNRDIDAASGWGSYVSALIEEKRELERNLRALKSKGFA